jgi:hypothetical protein
MLHLLQLSVHRPIDLDAQPRRRAVEVQDVRPDRVLPSKAQAQLLAA